jgi:hypothetical protein
VISFIIVALSTAKSAYLLMTFDFSQLSFAVASLSADNPLPYSLPGETVKVNVDCSKDSSTIATIIQNYRDVLPIPHDLCAPGKIACQLSTIYKQKPPTYALIGILRILHVMCTFRFLYSQNADPSLKIRSRIQLFRARFFFFSSSFFLSLCSD